MQRLPFLAMAIAGALLATGCATVNKKMNAEHLALANQAPSRTVAGGAYAPMPWAVGQWALYAVRYEDVWSKQWVGLVGEAGGAHWLEVETYDPTDSKGPARIRMQVKGYNAADPTSVKRLQIGTVITQNGSGKAIQAPPFIGPLTSGWALAGFKIDIKGATRSDSAVPAGTFTGASKIRTETSLGPIEVVADTWLHQAVPIWGIAQSKSTDGDHEQRLIDFGTSGAKSRIVGPVLGGTRAFGL